VEFSQFYASKIYLNPAFTGLRGDNSITTTYRNQWPAIRHAYESYFVSYDRKLKEHEAGISIYFLNDVAGEGSLRRQSLAFIYSKQVRFSKNIYASFGLKGSYNINSINWNNLTWGDMIDARNGFIYTTNQPRGSNSEKHFDSGAGAIVYSDKIYGGIAIEHLNRPKFGMLSLYNNPRIPIRYKIHAGGNIPLQYMPNASKINIAPQIIYTQQSESKQLILGTYFILNKFSVGVWNRIKDSFILSAGLDNDNIRFGYSFDIGTNKLMTYSGGAHEISLTYLLDYKQKEKKKKYKVISCPLF